MKNNLAIKWLVMLVSAFVTAQTMAIEEAVYTVVEQEGRFEIRAYTPQIVAVVEVQSDFEEAGNQAFRPLFEYISGNNVSRESIAMSGSVNQQSAASKKIAMTAPVSQQGTEDNWQISFMMPAEYRMDTIPLPLDPQVQLREIPAREMAVVRYSGSWSASNYQRNEEKLLTWLAEQPYQIVGDPVWARYNSPFSLWFVRRNEILIPVNSYRF